MVKISDQRNKVKCVICGKKVWHQNIQDHVQNLHFNQKRYKCERCNKPFTCKSNLNRHIREVHKYQKRVTYETLFLNITNPINI